MTAWEVRRVPLKYHLSDQVLLTIPLSLQCRSADLFEESCGAGLPMPSKADLTHGSRGFLIRAAPVDSELPRIAWHKDFLCYVLLQYRHYYIDLRISYEDYIKKFSSKTRSTIHRKIRKYAEHCGGAITWRTYTRPDEMCDFFPLARDISRSTYQERLLDAGLPDTEAFLRDAQSAAASDLVRAYILFDGDRPAAYLYCPVKDGVLVYAYVGYDPAYLKLSAGTVLMWLAIEQMFGERRFRAFDFTEGESEQKRLLATNEQRRANLLLLSRSPMNLLIVRSHLAADVVSETLGNLLKRFGLKARVKRLLRFAK